MPADSKTHLQRGLTTKNQKQITGNSKDGNSKDMMVTKWYSGIFPLLNLDGVHQLELKRW